MEYRREIDGLRAVAVIPVILFHAGFTAFPGGFVGVDIFFVISGYLITSLIIEEKRSSTFSLMRFYERRARRILPALLTVMFFCLPAAWVLLFPSDFVDFSNSLISVPLFASNFLFWKTSGYFEGAAEMKPLLHTWSLAVEEQYYLLFPIFFLLIWKAGRSWWIAIFSLIVVASLLAAQWASTTSPVAGFYLLPTRSWELILGALVAALQAVGKRSPARFAQFPAAAGAMVGLGLITVSLVAFDGSTPTPSIATLVPTMGAALVLAFAIEGTLAARILSSPWLVRIGLISYSLYLWHQPLLAFAKHAGASVEGGFVSAALIAVSVVLATASWHLVERPFRNRQIVSARLVLILTLSGSTLLMAIGAAGRLANGFDGRISEEQRAFLSYFENSGPEKNYFKKLNLVEDYRAECNFFDMGKDAAGQTSQTPLDAIPAHCHVRDPRAERVVMLWGDSHAQQLYFGLRQALPEAWQILQVTSAGCVPRIETEPDRRSYCRYSNWFALKSIEAAKPDVVVLGQNNGQNEQSMAALSKRLLASGVKKIVFVGPTPHWVNELPNIVAQRLLPHPPPRTLVGIDLSMSRLDQKLKASDLFKGRVQYVSLIDFFCHPDGCQVFYGDDPRAGITSYDRGHLTPIASLELAKGLLATVVASRNDDTP